MVPLARALGMDSVGAELESRPAATLRRPPGGTASGRLLFAAAAVLPPEVRPRWRAEWLAELQVLPARWERVTFAVQIVLGIGRIANAVAFLIADEFITGTVLHAEGAQLLV